MTFHLEMEDHYRLQKNQIEKGEIKRKSLENVEVKRSAESNAAIGS